MDRFVFYGEWAEHIKHLTIEEQDKIFGDMIRYGIDEDMAHAEDPVVSMAVNFVKGAIDNAKMNYAAKVEAGKINGIKNKKVNNLAILELAREGKKSTEIAEILGISKSAVDHSEGWKNRKLGK